MPKLMQHSAEARRSLARGVARLAAAVEPTLGPKGMNAMIDRPVGTPLITRDGVSIASEIELADRFENMGAQVAREVSMQTNEVAGDGTTTAIVLANAIIQQGVKAAEGGSRTVDLCRGIEMAVRQWNTQQRYVFGMQLASVERRLLALFNAEAETWYFPLMPGDWQLVFDTGADDPFGAAGTIAPRILPLQGCSVVLLERPAPAARPATYGDSR